MIVSNFLNSISYHFFNIIIIIIILIFLLTTYFLLRGKATDPNFLNISKQNLINIVFHRGDFVEDWK